MTTFLIIIAALTAAIAVYVLWLRKWLKTKPWAQGFFAAVEPFELRVFGKSETKLWARWKMVVGVLLTLLTQLGTIDLTPLMPFVPERYEGLARIVINLIPLVITAVGMADERLRNTTTKPIEVVAVPDVAPPEVAAAVAKVEQANARAVAVVVAEKAVS